MKILLYVITACSILRENFRLTLFPFFTLGCPLNLGRHWKGSLGLGRHSLPCSLKDVLTKERQVIVHVTQPQLYEATLCVWYVFNTAQRI